MSNTKAIWLLIGSYEYGGDSILACLGSEAEVEALKQWGLENKDSHGRERYGFDKLTTQEWKVGERLGGIPTL